MKSRIILTLCLLALCASPVLAAEATAAEADAGTSGAVEAAPDSELFLAEQGGCSMGQIRELQNWCSQKADVMSADGSRNCTSRGIHYCHASGGEVSSYDCAISCQSILLTE
jgi:hypothetical protein